MNKLFTNVNMDDMDKIREIGFILSGRNKKRFTNSMVLHELVNFWYKNNLEDKK